MSGPTLASGTGHHKCLWHQNSQYFIAEIRRTQQLRMHRRNSCFEFNPMSYWFRLQIPFASAFHKLHKFIKWKPATREEPQVVHCWPTIRLVRGNLPTNNLLNLRETHSIYPIFMRQTVIPCARYRRHHQSDVCQREKKKNQKKKRKNDRMRAVSHARACQRNRNIHVRTTNCDESQHSKSGQNLSPVRYRIVLVHMINHATRF